MYIVDVHNWDTVLFGSKGSIFTKIDPLLPKKISPTGSNEAQTRVNIL
jgi:hypothetical protein